MIQPDLRPPLSSGGGGGGSAFSGVRATRGANLSAPLGFSAVQWTAEDIDVTGWHDPATNPDRLTVPAGGAGYYLLRVSARLQRTAGAAGVYENLQFRFTRNGAALPGGAASWSTVLDSGVAPHQLAFECIAQLSAGDIVRLEWLAASTSWTMLAGAGTFVEVNLVGT